MQNMRDSIDSLRKEAETTLRALYALEQFRRSLSCEDCVEKINKNANFWLIYDSSVRTSLLLGIRRLYENKAHTFNFHKFVELCKKNVDSFSKHSLRSRKLSGSSNVSEWIDGYMEDVYEPTKEDFSSLAKVVRQNSKKMKGVYSDVASTVFAHAVHTDHASIFAKMQDLNFDEIETALSSIWHAYDQIWRMYENGSRPVLEITAYRYKKEIIDSVIQQLGCECRA